MSNTRIPVQRLQQLEEINRSLNHPRELGGVFLPHGVEKTFDVMLIAEMPSMREPPTRAQPDWNWNFDVTRRDKFLQCMMSKYGLGGNYVTDLVKSRDIPGKPSHTELLKWLPFLLREIELISPEGIIVLGKRTYESSFLPYVQPAICESIRVDWVFHYCTQVSRRKFEERFKAVVESMLDVRRL